MFALPAEDKVDVHKRNGIHLLSNLWFTKTHLGRTSTYITCLTYQNIYFVTN